MTNFISLVLLNLATVCSITKVWLKCSTNYSKNDNGRQQFFTFFKWTRMINCI